MSAMKIAIPVFVLALAFIACSADSEEHHPHHHHHHKHGKHHKHHRHDKPAAPQAAHTVTESHAATAMKAAPVIHAAAVTSHEHDIVDKMKKLEATIAAKRKAAKSALTKGSLLVNGPLPTDFNAVFAQGVSSATGVDAGKVRVADASATTANSNIVEVTFMAPPQIVKQVEADAADGESQLAKGLLRRYLVADAEDEAAPTKSSGVTSFHAQRTTHPAPVSPAEGPEAGGEVAPVEEKGIDIDTQMPYGDLEPFGREDTAQELTESSVKESNSMVDQLERAEVAEEKRAVFRALTRLRGAAITSFDGVARSQTGNIDEYNKVHKWRNTHPLHHLADEESDVSKWAFPDNADF